MKIAVKALLLAAGVSLIAYGLHGIYSPLCPIFLGVATLWTLGTLQSVSK